MHELVIIETGHIDTRFKHEVCKSLFNCCCLMYRYLISSFILMVVAFCCVNCEAGEVFGIFILAKFRIIFLRRHFLLKYMLALQYN